jgi:hypothetical protein
MVGAFKGPKLAALASYQPSGEHIAHVAVVSHPAFRGQGRATSAVTRLTQNVLEVLRFAGSAISSLFCLLLLEISLRIRIPRILRKNSTGAARFREQPPGR